MLSMPTQRMCITSGEQKMTISEAIKQAGRGGVIRLRETEYEIAPEYLHRVHNNHWEFYPAIIGTEMLTSDKWEVVEKRTTQP